MSARAPAAEQRPGSPASPLEETRELGLPASSPAREQPEHPQLERKMGLKHAIATNMLGMIGVGPFLTIPFMVTSMGGPHILYPWLLGAVLALCDGLVYAHFGAALPGSGGSYLYLREAFQPFRLGRMMSFLYIFQVLLVAPLSIAGGAVGFADYLGFFFPAMSPVAHDLLAAAACVVMTALLYRNIESVARLSLIMLGVVVVTVGWVVVVGLFNFSWAQAFDFPQQAMKLDRALLSTTASVALLAMYNYGGYNNVCNIAEEIREPQKNVPRAIVISIVLVVLLYIVMSTVILGLVPWREVSQTKTIASVFIGRTFADPAHGRLAAIVMNGLILFVTASSLYAVILGYSRIPFAAARDGQFFKAFERVHPTKHFPHVSLLTIGACSIPFCFLSLGKLVSWLILVQIALQFVWQCAGVILLNRYRKDIAQPFRMWLYPLPALVAFGMWIYVFVSAERAGKLFALGFFALSVVAYFAFARWSKSGQARPAVE